MNVRRPSQTTFGLSSVMSRPRLDVWLGPNVWLVPLPNGAHFHTFIMR